MLTGKEALSRIDGVISNAEEEARALARRLEEFSQRQLVLKEEERVCFADLARFRVNAAARDHLAGALDETGRTVEALLDRREAARTALEAEAAAAAADLEAFTQRREDAAETLEGASAELDEAEAGVQTALKSDPAFQVQLEKAEATERVAHEAETKRLQAQEDRKSKGAPYEADPLFMYLWDRGYGTADYRGRGIVRTLDGWVARLVGFEAARRNYFMLLEIPRRLKEHVDQMRARADAELEALVEIEHAARDASEVPELEARYKNQREVVDGIDADIARIEARIAEIDARRAAFVAGTDEHFASAVNAMSENLSDDRLADLKAAAYRTPEPEDERIVERLQRIDEELDETEGARADLVALQKAADARLAELQEMRREFRRKRYDDYTSEFEDDDLFGTLLREFIRGAVTGAEYWARMDRTHSRRVRKSRPDFGSGRFRFPGPTTFPGSRGGRSSGGFRTGGGFGGGRSGGGFRTGGGF